MNFDAALDDFILYLASERGLAKKTLEAYSHDVRLLIEFIHSKSNINEFCDVTRHQLVDFIAQMHDKKYAATSIHRTLIAIKRLFRYLKREKYIPTNITLYLDSPKKWYTLPEVLTHAEVENLLEQPDPNTQEGARDRAILELLYASGLRVSELCNLNIQDVDDEQVRVFGKGRKERLVPINQSVVLAIDHYLSAYREDQEQALFLDKGNRVTRQIVWSLTKLYAKKAGILKNIHPHTLRHSFATHLLDNGADIRVIQEMMGHANIASTDKYMHLSCNQIHAAFNQFHPDTGSGRAVRER